MMESAIWLLAIFLLLPCLRTAFSQNGDSPQQESRQHREMEMKLNSFSTALKLMEAKVSRLSEENQECKLANERMTEDFKLANEVMANNFKQDIERIANGFKQDNERMANECKQDNERMANDFKQDIERMTKATEKMATDIQQLKSLLHNRNQHVNFMPKAAGDLGREKRQSNVLRSPSIPKDQEHQKEPMFEEGMDDSAEKARNVGSSRNLTHDDDSRKKTHHIQAVPESVPRTCQELRNRGINISGAYLIDPDGHGIGDAPLMAQCVMTETSGTTLIYHDTLGPRDVQHCEGPGCHSISITYEAPEKQVIALADLSGTCTQTIAYRCLSAPLKTEDQIMAWWTGLPRNHQSADTAINNFYWDGNHNSTEHLCHCHLDDSCIMTWSSNSSLNHCNCDAGSRQWATDEGTLTNKAELPVTELRFGGLTSKHQAARFELGAFACSGNNRQDHQKGDKFETRHSAVLLATGTSDQQNFEDKFPHAILPNHPITGDTITGPRKVRSLPNDNQNQPDIMFDLPDLVTTQQSDAGDVELTAFPARGNGDILLNDRTKRSGHSKLRWVSIGNPRIVKSMDVEVDMSPSGDITAQPPQEEQLFHFTPEGIHTSIEMLTHAQRELLASQASEKYGVKIKPNQIINLSLSEFRCSLLLAETKGSKLIPLRGEVSNFNTYPLRMDFEAPLGSKGRQVFEDRLGKANSRKRRNAGLTFKCKMATAGKVEMTNILRVTSKQFQELGIMEELFGPANSTYVTRHQLDQLATRMFSDLDILEEYEMPEHQFSEAFLQGLLSQGIAAQFSDVPFRDAVAGLSRFASNFERDLQPDEIVEDLGSIFSVKKNGAKSHIVAKRDHRQSSRDQQTDASSSTQRKSAFFGLISGGGGGMFHSDRQQDSLNHDKSLDDQLSELNSKTQNAVKWAVKGSKVIPRSLNVARLSRGSFEKTISFKRVRREVRRAEFTRDTALYVQDRLVGSESVLADIQTRMKGIDDSVLCLQNLNIGTRMEGAEKDLRNAEKSLRNAEKSLRVVETKTSELMKWKEDLDRERNKLRNKEDWDSTESCRTLKESGHTAPGYYFVDGPGGTNYHLVKCNMHLDSWDNQFQIGTSAKLSEYPVAFEFSGSDFTKLNVPIQFSVRVRNDGDGMTKDGTFTVPLDGVYLITFEGYFRSQNGKFEINVNIDGVVHYQGNLRDKYVTNLNVIRLQKGQNVTCTLTAGSIYGGYSLIGILLYPN